MAVSATLSCWKSTPTAAWVRQSNWVLRLNRFCLKTGIGWITLLVRRKTAATSLEYPHAQPCFRSRLPDDLPGADCRHAAPCTRHSAKDDQGPQGRDGLHQGRPPRRGRAIAGHG